MSKTIAVIQMTSVSDVNTNLIEAEKLIENAIAKKSNCVVLPENFALISPDASDIIKNRESFGSGPIQDFLSRTAKKYKIWIIGGTIPLTDTANQNKAYSACLVYNDQGEVIARYNKIHLFDVLIRGCEEHHESYTISPGHEIIVVNTPFGKLGLAICYDVRFPELFRAMQVAGAEIIILPAAFTVPTGSAHWDALIRARAIENQVYIFAAAQCGTHNPYRNTYGHSMIVDPWGKIIAELGAEPGIANAEIDLNYLYELRNDFPVLRHRKY